MVKVTTDTHHFLESIIFEFFLLLVFKWYWWRCPKLKWTFARACTGNSKIGCSVAVSLTLSMCVIHTVYAMYSVHSLIVIVSKSNSIVPWNVTIIKVVNLHLYMLLYTMCTAVLSMKHTHTLNNIYVHLVLLDVCPFAQNIYRNAFFFIKIKSHDFLELYRTFITFDLVNLCDT